MTALFFKGINLIILIAAIFFLSRKTIHAYFYRQRKNLEKEMEQAASGLEKIQREYDEISSKVENLDYHLKEVRRQAQKDLEKEGEKVRQDAESFVNKIGKDTDVRVQTEMERARKQFEQKLIARAIENAEVELRSRMKKDDIAWTTEMLQSSRMASTSRKKTYA